MRANYTRYLHVASNGDLPRTIYPLPSRQLTTFNEGDLIPIYCQEVVPNSTYKINTRSFIRGSTPIFAVMDNAYAETFYFFVPNRLVWSHWKAFLGENENSAWDYDLPEYSIPQMTFNDDNIHDWTGELMDYFNIGACSYTHTIDVNGVVTETPFANANDYNNTLGKIKVSALPFRAYNLIYNHYFRDENVVAPVPVVTSDADENYWTYDDIPTYRHYKVRKASRYHDYFSSCLPAPQKGSASYLPMADFSPVITMDGDAISANTYSEPLRIYTTDGLPTNGTLGVQNYIVGVNNDNPFTVDQNIVFRNLWADVKNLHTTVEQLRQAIAVQRILELKARGGTRYVEIINSFFDCRVPDSTMQIPEYLGGTKFELTQQQVVQTSSTNDVSPLGTVSAVSKSSDEHFDFEKSFCEHGWIIGLACIRVNRTYQQGIERQFKRKDFYDFYLPQLANLGDQPVYNYELFATGSSKDDEIFGYNEAQASYRFKRSMVSGMFRRDNNFGNYLDAYHYADFYNVQPYLSKDWIEEGTENIDKTLAVEADKNHQFLCDFYFDTIATLPIPYNSIPSIEAKF